MKKPKCPLCEPTKESEVSIPANRQEGENRLLRYQLAVCQKELTEAKQTILEYYGGAMESGAKIVELEKELDKARAEIEQLKNTIIKISENLDPAYVYKAQLDKAIVDGFNKFAEMIKDGKLCYSITT